MGEDLTNASWLKRKKNYEKNFYINGKRTFEYIILNTVKYNLTIRVILITVTRRVKRKGL